MLVDEAVIVLKGGHGGAGKVSFYPGEKAGPDGGNGGKGGDLYIIGTSDLTALKQFTHKKTINAENGAKGESNRKFGKNGRDIVVYIPVGTVLVDKAEKKEITIEHADEKILVCTGGLGGWGNYEFKSSRNTTPMYSQPGLPGDEYTFQVSLKLIADFGLIGLPNAGKSSLLNELTHADAKTAAYPFTTLEPNLGVLNRKIMADIPGLIEGASEGKGLGIKFLKHIEKTAMLLHCVAADSEDVSSDVKVVMDEMKAFSADLAEKPQIILLTKSDLITKTELKKKITALKKFKKPVYSVSVHDWDSLEVLKEILKKA